ncbi:hypothetical protein BDY19DRAFT_46692 [Irpex rosettiformis]|uniref:Uncharacterized protein n=1 Tax=Irpex rosettiformis TaxID=378272 RepID=A0ACB8UKJ2_9APHY|nr:hypothetical protein BDY19DRAFT_46692 [Irpex rosettiformis]
MSTVPDGSLNSSTLVNSSATLVSESNTAASITGTAAASFINGSSSAPATSVRSSSARVSVPSAVANSVSSTTAVAPTSVSAGTPSLHQNFSSHISLPSSSVALVVTSPAPRVSTSAQSSGPAPPTRLPLPPVDPASATPVASISFSTPTSNSQVLASSVDPTTHLPVPPPTTSAAQASHSLVTSRFSAEITPPLSAPPSAVDMPAQASRRVNTPQSADSAASAPESPASNSGTSLASPSLSASSPVDTPAKEPNPTSDPSPSASKSLPPFSLPADPAPSTSESSQKGSPTVKAHTDASTSSSVSPSTSTHSSDSSATPSQGVGQPPSSPSHVSPAPSTTSADSSSQPPFQVPTQSPAPQPAPTQSGNFRATSVSTVSVPPESTFSSPVFITGTDSKGNPTPSIPPVITSVGVSTEPDGVLVSVTHIIANPTGIWGINDTTPATKHGFLANGGAVAGVFVVVGIIVTAIAAVVSFIMCKRRRRRRIRLSISKPLPMPDNPFEDPRETPSPTQMRFTSSDASNRNLVGTGLGLNTHPQTRQTRNLLDDEIEEIPGPVMAHVTGTSGFAGVGAGNKSVGRPAYNMMPSYTGPFSSYANAHRLTHSSRPSNGSSSIGIAITSDEPQKQTTATNNWNSKDRVPTPPPRHLKHSSLTPSTPSIYPPSLPNIDDNTETATITDDTHNLPITPSTDEAVPLPLGVIDLNSSDPPVPPPKRRPAPPLPPRSPLRPSSKHGESTQGLTISTQLPPPEVTTPSITDKPTTTSPPEPEPEQKLEHASLPEYEPLTPPASAISSGSSFTSGSSGRDSRQSDIVMPKPIVARSPSNSGQPMMSTFEEYNRMMARKTSMTGMPLPAEGKKDNFYTRRKVVNADLARRTSVEWRR